METDSRIRRDLAACYRMVAYLGWDDLVSAHISARLPGAPDQFLINPLGALFEEITASSLVRVNMHGEVLAPAGSAINPAGFVVHSAVYLGRPDVGAVIHLHTLDGVAVSMWEEGLLPLNQIAMEVVPQLAFHEYEGFAVQLDERARLQRDLGDKNLLLMRNHGTLGVGSCVAEAFLRTYVLERACTIQIRALAAGRALHVPSDDVIRSVGVPLDPAAARALSENLVWPAILRKIQRLDPSFEQ